MRYAKLRMKNVIATLPLILCMFALSSLAGQATPVVSVNAWLSATAPTDPISISMEAAASDTSGTISKVDFYQGSTYLGTATSAPYQYTWTNVPAGTYTIQAVATNTALQTASATTTLPTAGWIRIMPLGDSITQGVSGQNSYRRDLWHALRNNGYLADFVGTWQNNCAAIPIPDFDLNQNGWCGKQSTDLVAYVPQFASATVPNMVLLDIGTNDLDNNRAPSDVVASISTIIDELRAVNSNVTVIVAQISPTTQAYNVNIPALNSGIVTMAQQKTTAQSPVTTVDLNTGFDDVADTIDGLHPNNAGEEIFADRWYNGIQTLLSTGSAPLVTSSAFIDATVGTGITYTITGTNSPTSYNAVGLPAGLTRNNAVISGAPTAAGVTLVTISATNASGTGSKIITVTATPPGTFNETAFYTPGSTVTGGGADTYNNAYNAATLPASVTFNGSAITFGPANLPDAYNNETVNLPPGTYSTLNILATSGGGSVSNQPFTVHYQDGTTSTFTQSLSDWRNGVSFPNETAVVTMPSYLTSTGVVTTGTAYIYGYSFSLNAKPVQSLTLPGARQALEFGFGLIGTPSPVITSVLTATGTVGSAFSYTITATNSPTSYGASPLPAGVSVNTSTGVISGTPTTAGVTNTTISATNSGGTGTATLAVTINPSATGAIYQINCGGSAVSPFAADEFYTASGTGADSTSNTITTSGVINVAPMAVYQSERYGGDVIYTIPGLTSGTQYRLRLHFAETYWTTTGQRVFNIIINNTTVKSNFDIIADCGSNNKADVKEFTATANGSGQIVLHLSKITDNAEIRGIEVLPNVPTYQINCGGVAVAPFAADNYYSNTGTGADTTGTSISLAGATNPAPMSVYQSERYAGTVIYTMPNLTPGSTFNVRLHFAEIYWTAPGQREFNVLINGTQVLTNFDIIADCGSNFKADIKQFTATANSSGQIVIQLNKVVDNAKISGIEIIPD